MRFAEFLEEMAAKGEVVNLVFEERLFNLVGILQRIADPLAAAGIPDEVIGGAGRSNPCGRGGPEAFSADAGRRYSNRCSDLGRVVVVAQSQGFRFRHVAGVDMLMHGDKAVDAIHLLFSGEKVKSDQTAPNPTLAPERKVIKGQEVWVIPVADLVPMKLSANPDKDRIHVRSLDAAGLITPEIERGLPESLRTRLQQVRETE